MTLDEFSTALQAELNRRLEQREFRLVALVDVHGDDVLRERLAEACRDIAHPIVAVFEALKEPA